jgi:hypothetical protein
MTQPTLRERVLAGVVGFVSKEDIIPKRIS